MADNKSDDEIITDAAKEILLLTAEIKEKQERLDALKGFFKSDRRFSEPGKYPFGAFEVNVTTNQRISQKKAEQVLDSRLLQGVSTLKIDTKKARALLKPSQLDAIMDHYDHKIEVKLRDETELTW